MKKVNFQILSFFLCFLLFVGINPPDAKAQKYEIGGGLGTTAYTGDILRRIDLDQLGLQGTLFGKRNFDNVWTLRVGISAGTIGATDSLKPIDLPARFRNARFRGGLIEVSSVMEFSFLDLLSNGSEFRWSPYAFFGIGYAHFILKGNGDQFAASERYDFGTVIIPFGGGLKYRLDDRWTLGLEAGIRATFTDDLDKIDSSGPPIPRVNISNGTDQLYRINFGNPYDDDWYYFLTFTLSYTLSSTKCYTY